MSQKKVRGLNLPFGYRLGKNYDYFVLAGRGMERIPEPELMNAPEQVKAYVQADFEESNSLFVELFKKKFSDPFSGVVLDLGCGPADICIRLAQIFPGCSMHGVDGAPNMLLYGKNAVAEQNLEDKITLMEGFLPDIELPVPHYEAIISNSFLHHLADPQALWQTIKKFGKPGTFVLVMDLVRPANQKEAHTIVEFYSGNEPEILKEDFFNSLLGAYNVNEVQSQLDSAKLSCLEVEMVSDRHFTVKGFLS